MNSSPYKKGILYIDKQKFYLYIIGQKNMYSVDILPTLVKDLEVVDRAQFDKFIGWFISTNHIPQASLSVVLGESMLFRKELVSSDSQGQLQEQQTFIETVPFEHISSQLYLLANGKKEVVAINADFVVDVKKSFEARGFSVRKVVPTTVLGELSISTHAPDIKGSLVIQKKLDSMKGTGISTYMEQEQLSTSPAQPEDPDEQETLYLPYLLAGFGTLLVVLGIMIFWQVMTPPKTSTTRRQPTFVAPSLTPTTAVHPTTSSVAREAIQIRISTPTAHKADADIINSKLSQAGFAKIQVNLIEGTKNSQPLIIVASRVSSLDKQTIQDIVAQTSGTTPSIKENIQAAADVVITL